VKATAAADPFEVNAILTAYNVEVAHGHRQQKDVKMANTS